MLRLTLRYNISSFIRRHISSLQRDDIDVIVIGKKVQTVEHAFVGAYVVLQKVNFEFLKEEDMLELRQ